ncbi:hypothetical protein [Burkholderia ubonensis]|uniref:hypothetical protein n=1 Tax=Burkholderia ubonensis TaxID=101571 RepID=UPI000A86C825|nr:hypothetical protein [Burkholderia ubonensis]
MYEDFTSFDGEDWNGWENGEAAHYGRLQTDGIGDGKNVYWTGLVDMGAENSFEAAIKKTFNVDLSSAVFSVDYDFRIRERPAGHQNFQIVTTIPSFGVWISTTVDSSTPLHIWLQAATATTIFFSTSKEILIGLWRAPGMIERPQWEIDFDNIRIKERA